MIFLQIALYGSIIQAEAPLLAAERPWRFVMDHTVVDRGLWAILMAWLLAGFICASTHSRTAGL